MAGVPDWLDRHLLLGIDNSPLHVAAFFRDRYDNCGSRLLYLWSLTFGIVDFLDPSDKHSKATIIAMDFGDVSF